jgi:hypothetical protein
MPTCRQEDEIPGLFRDYAAGSWYEHVALSAGHRKDATVLIHNLFDPQSEIWGFWKRWFDSNDRKLDVKVSSEELGTAGRLYYASRFDLLETAEDLVRSGDSDITQEISSNNAALVAACARGQKKIIGILLPSCRHECYKHRLEGPITVRLRFKEWPSSSCGDAT